MTSIDTGLIEFLDMSKNPVPFDPITYQDRTSGWVNIPVTLNQIRVEDIINTKLSFGERDSKFTRTERYAIVTINSPNPILRNREWKIYNRIVDGKFSRSSPSFSQLCSTVRETTNYTTNMIKKLVTPHPHEKDEQGRWVYKSDVPRAVNILNDGLKSSIQQRILRVDPVAGKIEAIVSDKYVPVKDKDILTFLHAEIGDFSIVREFHDDRRSLFQVLPDKFAGLSNSEEYGMFISNSSTGINSIEIGLFIITGACTNGMMITESSYERSPHLRRKHLGEKEAIMDLIQLQCANIGEQVKKAYQRIELAKRTHLRGDEYSLDDLTELLLKPLAEAKSFSSKTVEKVENLLKEKYNNDSIWDFISALTDAAHEVPVNTREHVEKVAGNLLEILVPAQ